MEIKVLAPAKINLTLDVTGKRPDGYHNILSIMQSVDLYDTITVTDNDSGQITVSIVRASLVMKKIFVTKRRKDFLLLPVTKDRAYI